MATPDVVEVARQVEVTQTALNLVWTLLAAFLVMLMQAGFALVETGLTRAKHAAHTMAMNLIVYAVGVLGFWAFGFALQMGGVGAAASLGGDGAVNHEFVVHVAGHAFGLFGMKGFFLPPSLLTPAIAATFLFQMVFMDTAATIPTGAMAERWKLSSFVLFSLVVCSFIYPVYANWVWGGGWLAQLGSAYGLGHGHVDFAGSSVVHLTGAVLALVGARLLGPRQGRVSPEGEWRAIPPHNVPLVVVGTIILAFGWFGFNAGSTLSGTDARIAVICVNTMLASAAGAFVAYLVLQVRTGKPDITLVCNGMLAGLVGITAPCAYVGTGAAVVIGGVAGALSIAAGEFVERVLRVDDPVGAVAVHGAGGLWGTLAVGLFADGSYGEGTNGVAGKVVGLFYGGSGQLAAQVIGIGANLLWVGGLGALALLAVGKLVGNRASAEDELVGLDLAELGAPAYGGQPALAPQRVPARAGQILPWPRGASGRALARAAARRGIGGR